MAAVAVVERPVRHALRAALGDLYRNSWRLVPANLAVVAAVVVPVGLAAWTTRRPSAGSTWSIAP